jgi:hypothetical protein
MRGREKIDVATAAREHVWFVDHAHGKSSQEIADRDGVTPRRVRLGISRARAKQPPVPGETAEPYVRPPRLEPLFPVRPLSPESTCPHRWRIKRGSVFVCMICHRSGQDGHPGLRRNRKFDPKPEPKPSAPPPLKAKLETRRQRRLRTFGPPTPAEPSTESP